MALLQQMTHVIIFALTVGPILADCDMFELTVRCAVPGSDSGCSSRILAVVAAGAQHEGERQIPIKLQSNT
jgi:hypothetical protein